MAKIGTVTFTGASGTSYTFTVYDWGKPFPKDYAAVYCITKRYSDEGEFRHKVIYVGETEDLSTRFDNHHKQDCFDEYGKNCVCVLEESDEQTRRDIEADLIKNYKPPCNG